jgi:hypothetical protein
MCQGDTEGSPSRHWGHRLATLNFVGTTSVLDVQLAVNMSLGTTPCTANINGPDVCDVTTIQRVVEAALGESCVTGRGDPARDRFYAPPGPARVEMIFLGSASFSTTTPKKGNIISSQVISP